jgi:outer membrane immunogenic protein
MRRTIYAALAAGVCLLGTTAAMADGMRGGSIKDAPVSDRCDRGNRFAGLYIGANVGYAQHDADTVERILGGISLLNETNDGITAGLTVGYNWVCGKAMFGLEADWNWADLDNSRSYSIGPINLVQDNRSIDWYGTLRTRTGLVVDNVLVYMTGGLAYADIKHSVDIPVANLNLFNSNDVRWGWTIGAGIEIAHWDRLTIKTEALYMSFENKDIGLNIPLPIALGVQDRDSMYVGRIGFNWKLN